MKKFLSLILACVSIIFCKIQAQDIDSPVSLSEIENYESRVSLNRLCDVPVTHVDAYKIRTQQPVYSSRIKKIILDVINVDGPTAEPEYHWMEYYKNGTWVSFPFIDNLAFAGVGRDLSKGDTLPEYIYLSEFKYSLKPAKYKVHFYVFTNIYTYCTLTDSIIQPAKDSEMKGAFEFRILKSGKDSIRILFENHTNLTVQPVFLPSVDTDDSYSVHPLARSGWIGEAEWMRKHALIKGGQAIVFSIPTFWDINRIGNSRDRIRYKSGQLAMGEYKIGLQLEIYMETEFEVTDKVAVVKENRI